MKKYFKLYYGIIKGSLPVKLCSLVLTAVLLVFLFTNFIIMEARAENNLLIEEMREALHFDELTEEEISQGKYYRIVDERNKLITIMGRKIYVDDEYIASDNRHYRVYKVEDYTAYAELEGIIKLTPPEQFMKRNALEETSSVKILKSTGADSEFVQRKNQEEGGEPTRTIAIYHTHNAESYVPSDGTPSAHGKGGIHKVGRAFRDALKEKGIRVLFREDMHTPQDRAAYRRSRQTVYELLGQKPDAIFDIHRDAAPPEAYEARVDSAQVTKILFVVGRQNPHMEVNRQFALDLKSISDQVHPGLVKGIMLASGNYNQDLTPLNLLLEVGAHTNTKESAEKGITFFADSVGQYFYGTEAEVKEDENVPPARARAQQPPGGGGKAVRTGILRIISLAVIAGIVFFMINVGTWTDFKEKYGDRVNRYKKELYIIRDRGRDYLIKFRKWVDKVVDESREKLK